MTDVKMKLHLCKEPDKFQFIELKPSREKRTHLTREVGPILLWPSLLF